MRGKCVTGKGWRRGFVAWGVWALICAALPAASEGLLPAGPDEVLAAEGEVGASPEGEGVRGAPPVRPVVRFGAVDPDTELQRAWRDRGRGLEARAARLRDASLGLGIRDLDGAARALWLEESLGERPDRMAAAVLLAPGLPDAHARRAWSQLVDDRDSGAALASVRAGFRSVPQHLEASAWLRGSAVDALTRVLLGSGLLFLLVAAGACAPRVVRTLANRLRMPPASAAALVIALLLLPVAFGEGVAGVALALAVVAVAFGGTAQRIAAAGALGAVSIALHPLASWRDAELAVLGSDPAAEAVHRAERSVPTPLTLARLHHYAPEDALAARALAVQERREGDLEAAEASFSALLPAGENHEEASPAPELLANAANVRLALGDIESAIALYERAAQVRPTPQLLFNLSQVYGRAIRLEEQDLALAEAQTFDAEAVRNLIALVASHDGVGVVDLAIPPAAVRARAPVATATPWLRARHAPGLLGRSLAAGALGLLAAVGTGLLLGRFVAARPEPDTVTRREDSTDPTERRARLLARRARERQLARLGTGLAAVVPGLCALQKGRPLLGAVAVGFAVTAVVCFAGRGGVVPDPLAAGALGGLAFGCVALASALLYVLATGLSFAASEGAASCR